jgi:hypothetical protein
MCKEVLKFFHLTIFGAFYAAKKAKELIGWKICEIIFASLFPIFQGRRCQDICCQSCLLWSRQSSPPSLSAAASPWTSPPRTSRSRRAQCRGSTSGRSRAPSTARLNIAVKYCGSDR